MEVSVSSGDHKAQSYAFQAANLPEEIERLDDLHKGITEYFGDRLSLAPLETILPQSILEIGSGSGAWAIQAAKEFPGASVLAVDKSPLPKRRLPVNLTFQRVDLTEAFPFENNSFDVIHARFVIMHLPNGKDVLKRTFELLKPGGWLLVEEPDDDNMREGEEPPGPGMMMFLQSWLKIVRSRGAEPSIGRYLESSIKESGLFNEIHVRKVTIPISGKSSDPLENQLGRAWNINMNRVGHDLPQRFAHEGITPEVGQEFLEALNDSSRNITTDMFFTWSRRK